eukprot:992183_1
MATQTNASCKQNVESQVPEMSIKEEEMAKMKEEVIVREEGRRIQREICLLGDGKHYRLQHLWMDDEDDEIILQIDKYGQLQLKDTDFMRSKMDKGLLTKLKQTRSF